MRQLVRILVKVMPRSTNILYGDGPDNGSGDGGGSGNKVNNSQIRNYLTVALGEAPEPPWGVPLGWGAYLAVLFTWVLDRDDDPITQEQAMNCARRPQGRSWESVDEQIRKLGEWPVATSVVQCMRCIRCQAAVNCCGPLENCLSD